MREATAKERMLKNIRKALIEKTDLPYPKIEEQGSIFQEPSDLLEFHFAEAFTKVNGKFLFCETKEQAVEDLKSLIEQESWENIFCWEKPLQQWLSAQISNLKLNTENFVNAHVGITTCDALVARTGSVLLSSGNESGRSLSIYPNVHVVVAYTSQLRYDLNDALALMKQKYSGNMPSFVSDVTGPSRTADIEKTLVLGAHGPKEMYVVLIDDK